MQVFPVAGVPVSQSLHSGACVLAFPPELRVLGRLSWADPLALGRRCPQTIPSVVGTQRQFAEWIDNQQTQSPCPTQRSVPPSGYWRNAVGALAEDLRGPQRWRTRSVKVVRMCLHRKGLGSWEDLGEQVPSRAVVLHIFGC